MELKWERDAEISVRSENGAVLISANRAGLITLASHLTALAKNPSGSHIHLDDQNGLEDDSTELVIEKRDGS